MKEELSELSEIYSQLQDSQIHHSRPWERHRSDGEDNLGSRLLLVPPLMGVCMSKFAYVSTGVLHVCLCVCACGYTCGGLGRRRTSGHGDSRIKRCYVSWVEWLSLNVLTSCLWEPPWYSSTLSALATTRCK